MGGQFIENFLPFLVQKIKLPAIGRPVELVGPDGRDDQSVNESLVVADSRAPPLLSALKK